MQTSHFRGPDGTLSGRRSTLRPALALVFAMLAGGIDASPALARDGVLTPAFGRQPDAQITEKPNKRPGPGILPEMAMGAVNAPVTIVEYTSMTCSHCARFHMTTLPVIMKRYVDAGKVRYILREFPLDPRAQAGAMLARCAKGGYFDVVETLFSQQEKWAHALNAQRQLLRIVAPFGFSRASFDACLTDRKLQADIESVRERGMAELGVKVTPTFFVNGRKYTGAMSAEKLSAILDELL